MKKHYLCTGIALLLLTTGCESVKEGLSKVVLMDYDRVNNFRSYEFQQGTVLNWGGGSSEYGVDGWAPETNTNGFWATFVICDLRNDASKAQPFTLDLSKFYVEFDGKEHFYKPLTPYTFSSVPNGLPGNPGVTVTVNQYFRNETQIGTNTQTFPVGFHPTVNYRIAIYVAKTSPGPLSFDQELMLRYQGHPNIMNPRNQPPMIKETSRRTDLATGCRPPAQ